ncbi:MAG: primosomal protein [SAR86 cluster bacterium]|nr:primosomal protein [SAR86 cluster bacterium]
MKLISEEAINVEFLTEATKSGGKNYFIEGIFMQANKKNRNGRVYPTEILQKEAKRYTTEFIKKKRAFGELGHPDGPTVNLERVSHMIEELEEVGQNFMGRAKILDTPYGKIVKNLIDEGAQLGVSSRGMGSLKPGRNGISEVQDDFYLATAADIVADPSAPDAFVHGIMEGKEWVWDNGLLKETQIQEYKDKIEKSSRKDRENVLVEAFKDFIAKL